MRRATERTAALFAALSLLCAAKLDSKLWLPKKKGVQRLELGQQRKIALQDLEKGAQLLVKGPGVIICEAQRTDARLARLELELPAQAKDSVNLYAAAHAQTFFEVPEGLHTVEIALFAPNGAAGWAKLSYQPAGFRPAEIAREPLRSAPDASEPPAALARPPPLERVLMATPPATVRMTSGAKLDPARGWLFDASLPLGFEVQGPATLVFDIARTRPKGGAARVNVLRDGNAIATTLLDEETVSVECPVPEGVHTLTLRTSDARPVAAFLR